MQVKMAGKYRDLMKECLNSFLRKKTTVKQILKGSETQSLSVSRGVPLPAVLRLKRSVLQMGGTVPQPPWACVLIRLTAVALLWAE